MVLGYMSEPLSGYVSIGWSWCETTWFWVTCLNLYLVMSPLVGPGVRPRGPGLNENLIWLCLHSLVLV
jgi:hypothetical protein